MFDHIDEELMFSEYEIIFAVAVLLALIYFTLTTREMNRVISLSLLVGYLVYLIDFYLKDMVETVS